MEQQTKDLPVSSSRRQEGESRERRYTKQEKVKRNFHRYPRKRVDTENGHRKTGIL